MPKFVPGTMILGGRDPEEVKQMIKEAEIEGAKKDGVAMRILNHDGEIQVKYIEVQEIDTNEKNFYHIGDISELKHSIEKFGLKAPLDVQRLPNGRYKLLSGERRYTAIKELVAEGKHKGIVSVIITNLQDIDLPLDEEEKELLAMITTNKTQRVYSESDKLKEVEFLSKIYDKLKAQGIDIGKVGGTDYNLENKEKAAFIGEKIGTSTRQAYSYMKVEKKGNEEVTKALDEGRLSIDTASKVVDLEEEQQEVVLSQPGKITAKIIDEVVQKHEESELQQVNEDKVEYSVEKKEESETKDFPTITIPKRTIEDDLLKLSELAKDKIVDEREYEKYKKLIRQLNLCIVKMKNKPNQ